MVVVRQFLRNAVSVTHDPLLNVLRNQLGHCDFRPGQRKIIETITRGKDALVVMPTGGGKSLCYQLPALAQGGTTLVVSPLIALMKDQVDSLRKKAIQATWINSALSNTEYKERLASLSRANWRLLYVAPERFNCPEFMSVLQKLDIRLLAIDEAHCISQWGHDFRPAYGHLRGVRASLMDPPTVALTATASAKVQSDIVANLGINNAVRFVRGFDRPNIFLGVIHCENEEKKLEFLLDLVTATPALVYCSTKAAVKQACEAIRLEGDRTDIRVDMYHAGMSATDRTAVQDAFMSGRTNVVVATNAFGMGIDKSDIRTVIHFNHPGTIEAYYQEIGRAGRDGLSSQAFLLFSSDDEHVQHFFIKAKCPTLKAIRYTWAALRAMHSEEGRDDLFFTSAQLANRLKGAAFWEVGGGAGANSCLRVLEAAGFLNRISRRDRTMTIRLVSSDVDSVAVRGRQKMILEQIRSRFSDGFIAKALVISPGCLAHALGITRTQLLLSLKGLHEKGLIDFERPGNSGGVELLVNKDTLDSKGDAVLRALKRRNSALDDLCTMKSYADAKCLRTYVLEYFGEDVSFKRCGNCSGCNDAPQRKTTVTASSFKVTEASLLL